MNIKNNIIKYISSNNYKPMTKEELALEFNIDIKEYRTFFEILRDLEKEGSLFKTKREKYVLASSENLYKGILQETRLVLHIL